MLKKINAKQKYVKDRSAKIKEEMRRENCDIEKETLNLKIIDLKSSIEYQKKALENNFHKKGDKTLRSVIISKLESRLADLQRIKSLKQKRFNFYL